jgi:hypothetical protein
MTWTRLNPLPGRRMDGGEIRVETQTPWEFTEVGLVVLPDISWDEWTALWGTVRGLHRKALFFLGDALVAGERAFGEQYAQVLTDEYAAETHRVAQWVCSRIEPARRRPNLSFSVHREVASLPAADQDRLLDQAETGGWHTKDMREAVGAIKGRAGGRRNAATVGGQSTTPDPEQASYAPPARAAEAVSIEDALSRVPPGARIEIRGEIVDPGEPAFWRVDLMRRGSEATSAGNSLSEAIVEAARALAEQANSDDARFP